MGPLRFLLPLVVLGLVAESAGAQNTLTNPELGSSLSGWTPVAGAGVTWAWDNVNGFPGQGAAFGLNAQATGPSAIFLRQCVPVVSLNTFYTLHGVARVATGQGSTGYATAQWAFYDGAGCTGFAHPTNYSNTVSPVAGDWVAFSDQYPVLNPVGATSALVELAVVKNEASGAFAGEFDHLYFGPPLTAKGDFDRDGHADLVLRQIGGATAHHELWLMNGGVRQGTQWPIGYDDLPAAWQLAGVDDFNVDKQQDLVLWNSQTGAVDFRFLVGNVGWATVALANPHTPDWTVAATADFNHDGQPDLLWRNLTTQALEIWTLNGTQKTGTITPSPGQAVDGNWSVVAALDFNGDYNTDLLWYNATSGKIVLWFMNASVVRTTGQFTNPPNAGDNNWKVVAAADYGVGPGGVSFSNDIVWRNETSGNLVIWYMDKAGNRTSGSFTSPTAPDNPLGWTVAGPR